MIQNSFQLFTQQILSGYDSQPVGLWVVVETAKSMTGLKTHNHNNTEWNSIDIKVNWTKIAQYRWVCEMSQQFIMLFSSIFVGLLFILRYHWVAYRA